MGVVLEDDGEREMLLGVLADVVERFNWRCYAYCLMGRADRHLTVARPLSRWSIRGEWLLTGEQPELAYRQGSGR